MRYRQSTAIDSGDIVQLFASVFGTSEGQTEGELISKLARDLFEKTSDRDLFNCVAEDAGQIIGSIFFSRLEFKSNIAAFILAPVAVLSDYQGKGIGKALINFGLNQLKNNGVRIVLTYGDPGFYQKVGFRSLSHETIKPPFNLTYPEGWLGQSLSEDSIEAFSGSFSCVQALSDQIYW